VCFLPSQGTNASPQLPKAQTLWEEFPPVPKSGSEFVMYSYYEYIRKGTPIKQQEKA